MKKVIVCDIDGTLADCSHRLHYIKQDPPDWRGFCSPKEVIKDEVIQGVADVLKAFACHQTYFEIVLCTGRDEGSRDATLSWLRQKRIPWDVLLMRAKGDLRHDSAVKPELLAQAGYMPDKVLAIFEDRTCMVDRWRELGYTCFQVANGDF
jgi:hypothetical protein